LSFAQQHPPNHDRTTLFSTSANFWSRVEGGDLGITSPFGASEWSFSAVLFFFVKSCIVVSACVVFDRMDFFAVCVAGSWWGGGAFGGSYDLDPE
jgi:hypothetical protein